MKAYYSVRSTNSGFFEVLYQGDYVLGPFRDYNEAKSFIFTMHNIMEKRVDKA